MRLDILRALIFPVLLSLATVLLGFGPAAALAAEPSVSSEEVIQPLSEKDAAAMKAAQDCAIPRKKKDVLMIGDSISIGYTKAMYCQPDFEVIHNNENARSTWVGRGMVHDWLSMK